MKEFLNKIIYGDCLDVLKTIPDESIDLILTDPPYPIDTNNGTNRFSQDGWIAGSQDSFDDKWYNNFHKVVYELVRVLKTGQHFYCFVDEKNLFLLKPLLDKYAIFKKVIVWDKINFGLGYHYRNVVEYCLLYSKGKSTRQINDQPNLYRGHKGKETSHPTAKSFGMAKWLIRNSTEPGEIVLDSYCGSGTFPIAAKAEGRKYIGIDKEKKWCNVTEAKLKQQWIF